MSAGSRPPEGPEGPERSEGFGRRFLLGSVYLGTVNWVSFVFNFAIQIGLARLLGPEDFGLYAFVLAINAFLNLVASFALGSAIVQAREESQSLYDTALVICLLLGGVGLLVAGIIAAVLWFERSPDAALFLLVLAGARVLLLATQVPYACLERALRYGPLSVIGMTATSVPNVMALGLAWIGIGPWCLVLRDLLTAVLRILLETIWSGYRFRGRVERQAARKLMSFSAPMFLSRSLEVTLHRVDRVLLGALMGDAATGLVDRARFLAEAGLLATRPLSSISFNLYSRLQDDAARLSRSFGLINYFLALLVFAGATTLLVFPSETIRLLLGDQWGEAAPILRALGIYAAVLPLLENVKQILYALGTITTVVRILVVQLIVLVPWVLFAVWTGDLTALGIGVAAVSVLGLFLAWYLGPAALREHLFRVLALPAALMLVSVGVSFLLLDLGLLDALPWFARPFVPPLLYGIGVIATDRRNLVREIGYLRGQLRNPVAEASDGGSEH